VNHDKIVAGVKLLLEGLDCDLHDQNYIDTPERVAKAYRQMFTPVEKGWATFDESYTDLILLRDHTLWTLCPHHLLPVHLRVSIAYIPKGRVIGLSKLARVLHEINRGPMLQEAFTEEALKMLLTLTGSSSGVCLVEGEHGCMRMRGVRTPGDVVTFRFQGEFEDPRLQDRVWQLVRRRH